MNKNFLSILLLAVAFATIAAATAPKPRTAKVTDSSGAESQVSNISVSGDDDRFNFSDYQVKRVVIATKDIVYSLPFEAVSLIDSTDGKTWTVKYQTEEGVKSILGDFNEAVKFSGDSEFGAFSLTAGKLKRLEFLQAGVNVKPGTRSRAKNSDKKDEHANAAVLKLTDGTSIQASDLFRHANYNVTVVDTNWIPAKRSTIVENKHYTNFTFIYGETVQTITFEKIKTVDFASGGGVTVTTKSDAKAEMKQSQKEEETLTGFTGICGNIDFYIQAKYVKSITFESAK